MVFTATILTTSPHLKIKVDYNRETVHPESPHRLENSLLDERVPLDWIVICDHRGAVSVFTERPKPPEPGKQTETKVSPEFLSSKQVWAITPSSEGVKVMWFENWVYVPCNSKAHCLHLIDLLQDGKIPSEIEPLIV